MELQAGALKKNKVFPWVDIIISNWLSLRLTTKKIITPLFIADNLVWNQIKTKWVKRIYECISAISSTIISLISHIRKYLTKSTSSWIQISLRIFFFNNNRLFNLKTFMINSKQLIKICNNIIIYKSKIAVLRLDKRKSDSSIYKEHNICEISFLYSVKNFVSKWKPIIKRQKLRKKQCNSNSLAKAKSTLRICKNQWIQ
jgi:hypothetical protein